MRIDPAIPPRALGVPAVRTPAGGGFAAMVGRGDAERTQATATGLAPSIESLLLVQAETNDAERRSRGHQRARAMLDELDRIQRDLMAGVISPDRLRDAAKMLRDAAPRQTSPLDDVLDQIELRLAVELAKRGICDQ